MDVEKLRAKFDALDRREIRGKYGYRKEDLVIASVCRLIPVKGVHILIEAFASARKEVPELKLLVAGAGDPVYTQGLKDQVRTLHLDGDVLFIGNEPAVEKPLRAADIFAAAYRWPEAFGLSVLEAMTVGLPVVGSICGGLPDLLEHGKCGLLFEEGNIPELASCLLRFAKDASLRSEMGKVACRAASGYTALLMCERIQKVYERILKGKA
jgi:glycosyltransferase involved in cell wall biosynthesis